MYLLKLLPYVILNILLHWITTQAYILLPLFCCFTPPEDVVPAAMHSLKDKVKEIRRKLNTFLAEYSKDISEVAFELGATTFAKTRYTSHIYFLHRCLRGKVIPKGFKLKFSPPSDSIAVKRHLTQCSKNLMHTSIATFRRCADNCTKKFETLKQRLSFFCSDRTIFIQIRNKIHELNTSLFTFLKDVKQKKFEALTGITCSTQQPNTPSTSNNIVRTIPDETLQPSSLLHTR